MLSSFKRRLALLVGVAAVTGMTAASPAAVIYSNFGPQMTYDPDLSYIGHLGAFLSYNGTYTASGDVRSLWVYASFTTPAGSDWMPTSATVAVNTFYDVEVQIVADAGGVPSTVEWPSAFGGSSGQNPMNNQLRGFVQYDGVATTTLEPGYEMDPEWNTPVPTPMKGNTKYWLMLRQVYTARRANGPDADSSWTRWYRSLGDVEANSIYVRDLPVVGNFPDGGFLEGARPVFQIEATAVPVPEPATTALAAGAAAVVLLRRRRVATVIPPR